MSPENKAALATARKNPDLFYTAFRLLFGEQLGYRWEQFAAIRGIIEIISGLQYEFSEPEEPPRAAQVTRLLAETEEASHLLREKVWQLSELFVMYAYLLYDRWVLPNEPSAERHRCEHPDLRVRSRP